MSEQQYRGVTFAQATAGVGTPEFRAAMAAAGVTTAEAAEHLHVAGQHFDLAEFEMLIATVRPELWKRINREPSRWDRLRAWGRA